MSTSNMCFGGEMKKYTCILTPYLWLFLVAASLKYKNLTRNQSILIFIIMSIFQLYSILFDPKHSVIKGLHCIAISSGLVFG